MSLSAKDFNQAADILRAEREHLSKIRRVLLLQEVDRLEERLIAWFQAENPRFDPARFRRAAQP